MLRQPARRCALLLASALAVATGASATQRLIVLRNSTRPQTSCGFEKDGGTQYIIIDCPRTYPLELVDKSAAEDEGFDLAGLKRKRAKLPPHARCDRIHGSADVISKTGGWCYSRTGERPVVLGNGQSYMLPWHHVSADSGVLNHLISLVDEDPEVSISDFGAGVGQYGHALLAARPAARYRGYDGGGNVEAYSKGFVTWFDLSKPLRLPKSDWVMSLEVGEHIPNKHEMMVVRNLHRHNTKGLILSWAKLGQLGFHHVNNHSPKYLRETFDALGYVYDRPLSARLRNESSYPWFQRTIRVFRRRA